MSPIVYNLRDDVLEIVRKSHQVPRMGGRRALVLDEWCALEARVKGLACVRDHVVSCQGLCDVVPEVMCSWPSSGVMLLDNSWR